MRYPDGSEGLLVYLRPTLTGDEGDGLLHAAVGSTFPDDDPMDQFYAPAKMNTYRLLGRHIATELMHDPVMRAALDQFIKGERVVDGRPNVPSPPCDCREEDDCDVECEWRRQPRIRSMSFWAGAADSQQTASSSCCDACGAEAPHAEANGQADDAKGSCEVG
jgi:hypothetical protein